MLSSPEHVPTPNRNRPPFIRVNGRMVRSTKGKEVVISCAKLGSSMERFATSYPIGFHKWY